jgi:uncharacterized protein YecT (DUF1311 family)
MKVSLIKVNYESLIFEFRGYKVIVDQDLASLYETETKVLKQQVKRNIDRFPKDFMFELTKEEKEQLVTNCDRLSNLKHSSVNPLVFTEKGVAMLSSVLKSEKAIQINIEIMRAFTQYRSMLNENKEWKKEIQNLDKKLNQAFKYLLEKIDALHQTNAERKKLDINLKTRNKKCYQLKIFTPLSMAKKF